MRLNLHGCISNLGYGQVCGYLLRFLVENGIDVTFFPIANQDPQDSDRGIVQFAINNIFDSYDPASPSLKVWHEDQLFDRVGRGPHWGLPFFERNRFDQLRKISLNTCDLILSPSAWGSAVLSQNGIKAKIVYCPMGVDRNIFHERYTTIRTTDETRFVNINKIEVRKGHKELIEAFNKAFEPKDKVRLYLAWHNPFLTPEETRQWEIFAKRSKLGDKISIIDPLKSNIDIARLISSCDCSVCPTKAEGWGMSLLETLSCGKHLITTNYGAQTEFANPNNSRIIEIEKLTPANDGKWFHGDFEWADFGDNQMDQLVQYMREVHMMEPEQKMLNPNGISTAEKFSWNRTASIIQKELACL